MAARKRVLITGAGGFLGSHIARAVLSAGADVFTAVRPGSSLKRLQSILKKVRVVRMDMAKKTAIPAILKKIKPEIVIHCAAHGVRPAEQNDPASFDVNVFGTLALLEAAAACGAKRFVQLGSCFEYKGSKRALRENDALGPNSAYSASKAAASIVVPSTGRQLGIETLVLRCFSVWGPFEDKDRLVPSIVRSYKTQTVCELTPGEQIRDYSFVTDMAGAIAKLSLLKKLCPFDVVNVGSGKGIAVKKFARQVAGELGSAALLRFGARPYRQEEKLGLVADISRMKKLIGPLKRTPLKEGLRQMVALA